MLLYQGHFCRRYTSKCQSHTITADLLSHLSQQTLYMTGTPFKTPTLLLVKQKRGEYLIKYSYHYIPCSLGHIRS